MRIHNDGIAGPAASQSTPAESAAQPGSSTLSASVANGGTDQVDISSLSGNVAASAGALASQQAARVSQLAALYSRGEYRVDSMEVSRALVSAAISGSSMEEDS
jgi:hypothetical protein